MFWLLVHGGPVGFDPETFRGPFLVFLGFGQYTLPLLVYELYRKANENERLRPKFTLTLILTLCTLITATGIFAATMGMWLLRITT